DERVLLVEDLHDDPVLAGLGLAVHVDGRVQRLVTVRDGDVDDVRADLPVRVGLARVRNRLQFIGGLAGRRGEHQWWGRRGDVPGAVLTGPEQVRVRADVGHLQRYECRTVRHAEPGPV